MFLDADSLKILTGKRRRSAQVVALRTMGVNHRVRPDGFPLVMEAHVAEILGVKPKRQKPEMGPIA